MNHCLFKVSVVFICLFTCATPKEATAQSYGLGFSSHEAITDKRTTLDLFPHSAFHAKTSFELSFDLGFLANKPDYFGYIFRAIENGKRNFDLVYNKRDVIGPSAMRNQFKLVIGDRYSNIDFDVTPAQLFQQWNNIRLRFDYDNNEVVLLVNGHEFKQPNITFDKENIYRIIFGVCKENNFKASDCSAFKIRNVRIKTGKQFTLKYCWPLDEFEGNSGHDSVNTTNAEVTNPVWMRAEHANWRDEGTLHAKGLSSIAYNPVNEDMYVTSKDSLWTIASRGFEQTAIGYQNQQFNLLASNETVYNPYNGKLYNYYVEIAKQKISVFDPATRQWSQNAKFFTAIDFWQSNSFFCKSDSSLYVVGGYGRMTYKNTVWRYSLATKTWEKVKTSGYFYSPRYLTACGTTDNGNTAYFLGGYGSRTGEQMLNAKNFYDLVKFDVKTKTFHKLFDLPVNGQDFVFANTMVIDEKTRNYFALVFSNQKFNSELKLLKGSLDNSAYQLIGSSIPFAFHDTHSAAKLFYNKSAKQFVAVTMNRPMNHEQESYYHFYSLLSPPENLPSAVFITTGKRAYLWPWLFALIAVAGGTATYFFYRNRRHTMPAIIGSSAEPTATVPSAIPEHHIAAIESKPAAPAIHLFGNLTIYNEQGEDLSGHFTSLVRELFLVILIYSIKSNRGITPEKLLELLWPDKSEESARNNRAANLSKLRSILNQISQIRLSKDTGNVRIDIDYAAVYVDYWEYLQIIAHRRNISNNQVRRLIEITARGAFITGVNYHWLEQIKTDIANEAIDIYLASLNTIKPEEQPDFAIELANAIFVFDILNEDAMMAKCRALFALGKHSLARSTFDTFNKEFKDLYGENFKTDFTSIVNHLTTAR